VAIQYPMRNPGVSSVVVGASSPREIEDSVTAANTPLDDGIWAEVEERIAAMA
jgi:aryl-alcohol dehydrogenase-like predicted oxidoreductase